MVDHVEGHAQRQDREGQDEAVEEVERLGAEREDRDEQPHGGEAPRDEAQERVGRRGGDEPPEGGRPRVHQDAFSPYTRWYSCHESITRFTNARVSL